MTPITLRRLDIKRFRGFRKPVSVEFGRVTLVIGRNGLGKTTLLDALDWALFSPAWRFAAVDDPRAVVRNLWEPAGEAEVSIELSDGTAILRNEQDWLHASSPFKPDPFLQDAALFKNTTDAVTALRTLVYLSEERLRGLLDAGTSSIRRAYFNALAGVPFVDLFLRNAKNTVADIDGELRAADAKVSDVATELSEIVQRLEAARDAAPRLAKIQEEARAFLQLTDVLGLAELRGVLLTRRQEEVARKLNAQAEVTDATQALARVTSLATLTRQRQIDLEFLQQQLGIATRQQEEQGATEAEAQRNVVVAEKDLAQRDAAVRALRAEVLRLELWEAAESNRSLYNAAVARHAKALSAVEEASAHLRRSQEDLSSASARASLHARWTQLTRELESALAVRVSREQALANATQNMEGLTAQQDAIGAQLVSMRAQVDKRVWLPQRAAVLLDQLRKAAGDTPRNGECPLCGYDHGSSNALQNAMDSTVTKAIIQSEALEHLDRLDNELGRVTAALETTRSERDALSSGLKPIAENIEQLEGARTLIEARLRPPWERRELEAARIAVGYAEEVLRAAQSEAGSAASEVRSREGTLDAAEKAAPGLGDLGFALGAARSRLAESERELLMIQSAVVDARQRRALIAAQTAALRDQVGRLSTSVRENGTATEALVHELQSLGGQVGALPAPDASLLIDALKAKVVRAQAIARASDETSIRAQSLSANLEQSVSATAVAALEAEKVSIETTLREMKGRRSLHQRALENLDRLVKHVSQAVRMSGIVRVQHASDAVGRVMTMLNPHRHLNVVELLSSGELRLKDSALEDAVDPQLFSSTGQLNCIGLAVFIGVALRQSWSRLGFLILDDAIQDLDDVNALNLIDLLRQLSVAYQIVFSTSNANAAQLLKRKFRLWAREGGPSVRVCEFKDFDREIGPGFEMYDLVNADVVRLSG